MIAIPFDALIFSQDLTDAGMPRKQADKYAKIQKGVIDTQNQNVQEILNEKISTNLATKEDILIVKQDISNLRHELKHDTANLDKKISLLRKEFEGKFNLLYWMSGFILAFCASNAAIIFKIYSHFNV